LNKEFGGLWVKRIKELNAALLGKWCWRLREERERLWCRVLVAHYGEEGSTIKDGGRLGCLVEKYIYYL